MKAGDPGAAPGRRRAERALNASSCGEKVITDDC